MPGSRGGSHVGTVARSGVDVEPGAAASVKADFGARIILRKGRVGGARAALKKRGPSRPP